MNGLEKLVYAVVEEAIDKWREKTYCAITAYGSANHIIIEFDRREIDICIKETKTEVKDNG